MAHQKYIREMAINKIINDMPALNMIPENSETFKDFIFSICSEFGISRRTAKEYIYTARAKINKIRKEEAERNYIN